MSEDERFHLRGRFAPAHDNRRSEWVVLDASRFEAPWLARVTLPQRVPHDFLGSRVQNEALA